MQIAAATSIYLTNFASVAGKSWRATAVEAIDLVDASSVVQTSNIDTVVYICRRENQRYIYIIYKSLYRSSRDS